MTTSENTREAKLLEFLVQDLPNYSHEQLLEIQEAFTKHISFQVDSYLEQKKLLTKPAKDTATLFNGLLTGTVKEIQNFNEKGVGRRLFAKPVETTEGIRYQPYVRNRDGKEEEWNITLANLNKGRWAEVPLEQDHVGYGIAMEALLTGEVDYIRCEDWSDQTLLLKREMVYYGEESYYTIKTVATGAHYVVSPSSRGSRNWIMFSLSKVA